MDFQVDLQDVVDEVLDRNKKLILETILLQKSLGKAAIEIERLEQLVNAAAKEAEMREMSAVELADREAAISTP